jgi:putative photosynthetic complex assembly protein
MAAHVHTQTVPRGALLGAAFLIVGTLTLAAVTRRAHLAAPVVATAAPRESLDVRFEDRKDGTLAVVDASNDREVATVPPGTNGFIRGVVRGMFRGRKLEAMGREGHFRLAREADGRLTLEDPQTGRRVDLDSFGPTNSAAFADLLTAGRRAP